VYWSLNPYSHNSDLSLCWSSNIKLDLVNMKIRLCTKAKLYSVREVNDFYFSIGYASGFNLHERSDLAHFPGALQSIWSRLQPTRSSYSKTRYYFNCPRRLNINLTLRWLALLQHLLRTEEVTTPPHMVVYCSPSAIFQGDEHLFTKVKNLYIPCPATCFLYNQVKT